jgi:predicted nucleic acid-binding protein
VTVTEFDFEAGAKTYVDANAFIYLFEDAAQKADTVARVFERIAEAGGSLVTSELTIAECCYKPARDRNAGLIAIYERFLESSGEVSLVPLTGAIAKQAVFQGAELGLKLLDAIHYTSALEFGCTSILTGDGRFKSNSVLKVIPI